MGVGPVVRLTGDAREGARGAVRAEDLGQVALHGALADEEVAEGLGAADRGRRRPELPDLPVADLHGDPTATIAANASLLEHLPDRTNVGAQVGLLWHCLGIGYPWVKTHDMCALHKEDFNRIFIFVKQ